MPFRYLGVPLPSKKRSVNQSNSKNHHQRAVNMSKKALVSWETVRIPHVAVGLNITELKLWNKAVILRQLWNIARKKDCLWIQW
ncbi:hypothetical protein H5410_036856, partial [Solanum commersonii]